MGDNYATMFYLSMMLSRLGIIKSDYDNILDIAIYARRMQDKGYGSRKQP